MSGVDKVVNFKDFNHIQGHFKTTTKNKNSRSIQDCTNRGNNMVSLNYFHHVHGLALQCL